MTEGQKRANERLFAVASSSRILDEEEVISSSDDEENTLAKKSKESLINKAYRPNAHLLESLMHYNIILHYCYNYYSCINIICNSDHL